MAPSTEKPKGLNLPVVLVGGIASAFVGTIYGYAYLKDAIKDYWKAYGDDPDALMATITNAAPAGFMGQYLAVIPGLVFDYFGAAVTCWYGGLCCLIGFSLVGYSVPRPNEAASYLVLGMFLAGQGSKGLGFGTLLGTVKTCADEYASAISGTFLMLDAASSVILMYFYDLVWQPTFQSGLDPKEDKEIKANNDQYFFMTLGATIFTVALVAGIVYMILLRQPVPEADVVVESGLDDALKNKATYKKTVNGRRLSTASAGSRTSSIADEAAISTFRADFDDEEDFTVKTGAASATKSALVSGKPVNEPAKEQASIPWFSLFCVFAVLATGEASGLAFNAAIGESFMAHRMTAFLSNFKDFAKATKEQRSLFTSLADEIVREESEIVVSTAALQKELGNSDVSVDMTKHGQGLVEIKKTLETLVDNIPSTMEVDTELREFRFFNPSNTYVYAVAFTPDWVPDMKDVLLKNHHESLTVADCSTQNISANMKNCNLLMLFQDSFTFATGKAGENVKKALKALRPVSGLLVGKNLNKDKETEAHKMELHFLVHNAHHHSDMKTLKAQGQCTLKSCAGLKLRKKTALHLPSSRAEDLRIKFDAPAKHSIDTDSEDGTRLLLRKLFKNGSLNFQESSTRGSKPGVHTVAYPTYADAVKNNVESLPFFAWAQDWEARGNTDIDRRMVLCYTKLNKDGKCPQRQIGGVLKLLEEAPFYFDAAAAHDNKKFAKNTKRGLTITFALSNAIGRLAVGFMADPFDKMSVWCPLSMWFVLGSLLNVIIYMWFYFLHPGSCQDAHTSEGQQVPPTLLFILSFLAAFSYGGIFTINTSYMKSIIPAEKVGVILGCSLMILAIGNFLVQQIDAGMIAAEPLKYKIVAAHEVSDRLKEPFFLLATLLSLFALLPGTMVYLSDVNVRKQKRALESDDYDDLTTTSESED